MYIVDQYHEPRAFNEVLSTDSGLESVTKDLQGPKRHPMKENRMWSSLLSLVTAYNHQERLKFVVVLTRAPLRQ